MLICFATGKPCYSYYQLTSNVTWPADVDPAHRELHLDNAEFTRVIGITYGAYERLPMWRKVQLKREVDLF